MSDLAKTQTVMQISTKTRMMPSNTVPFDSQDGVYRSHQFFLDSLVWDDMGSPDTITVTVEPGDKLNA